mmetsp:Transcript_38898/g.70944  ORF Transcript_38898/g.70944 Transcript_38898/m.70944 type:complete len:301 (+) Transcript_38898:1-903(+)
MKTETSFLNHLAAVHLCAQSSVPSQVYDGDLSPSVGQLTLSLPQTTTSLLAAGKASLQTGELQPVASLDGHGLPHAGDHCEISEEISVRHAEGPIGTCTELYVLSHMSILFPSLGIIAPTTSPLAHIERIPQNDYPQHLARARRNLPRGYERVHTVSFQATEILPALLYATCHRVTPFHVPAEHLPDVVFIMLSPINLKALPLLAVQVVRMSLGSFHLPLCLFPLPPGSLRAPSIYSCHTLPCFCASTTAKVVHCIRDFAPIGLRIRATKLCKSLLDKGDPNLSITSDASKARIRHGLFG